MQIKNCTFNLTNTNFIVYAANNYYSPSTIDDEEFFEDLQKLEVMKKSLKRLQNGFSNEKDPEKIKHLIRILLNNIITFKNVFGVQPSLKLLLLKLTHYYSEIKTFYTFLNCMPEIVYGLNHQVIYDNDIPINKLLVEYLRQIDNNKTYSR